MKHDFSPLPRLFRFVFMTIMMLLCAFLFWLIPQMIALQIQIDDLTLSLDTSHQREAKQQYEYDQVSAQLPLTQAELDSVLPQAETAAAHEQELRTQRKSLRAQFATLNQQLENALASSTDLEIAIADTEAQVAALHQQVDTLQSQVDALNAQLNAIP